MTDFQLTDAGSIQLLTPISVEAQEWVNEHIGDEVTYWGHAIAIESNYLPPILEGIVEDGMTVEEG